MLNSVSCCCRRRRRSLSSTSDEEDLMMTPLQDGGEGIFDTGKGLDAFEFLEGTVQVKETGRANVKLLSFDSSAVGAVLGLSSVAWVVGKPRPGRLLSLSRFKLWWMRPHHISKMSEVPEETQLLLLDRGATKSYSVFLPLLDGPVRCVLQGGKDQTLQLLAETGDKSTPVPRHVTGLLVATGGDPFTLLEDAYAEARKHLARALNHDVQTSAPSETVYGSSSPATPPPLAESDPAAAASSRLPTASLHQRRRTFAADQAAPRFVDQFGWCTWDSCYTAVDHDRLVAGLESLKTIHFRPRWLVLDDGWQSVGKVNAPNGKQWQDRLTGMSANWKFHREGGRGSGEEKFPGRPGGSRFLRDTVAQVKAEHGIETFMVWHAVGGYWHGVDAAHPDLQRFRPQWQSLFIPPSIVSVDPEMKLVARVCKLFLDNFNGARRRWGYGLVPPSHLSDFYMSYHGYLQGEGVDGVKVDAQAMLGCLGNGHGGSVALNFAAHSALNRSVEEHFDSAAGGDGASGGSHIIHCMCHDSAILLQLALLYGPSRRPLVRGSDDFYPREDASHGPQLYANAYNSLLLSFCGLQDWDMFQTNLGSASWIHAASRAISGGPVYVSDRPSNHNPAVLEKLVLEDGSIPRPSGGALPTLDCLFHDAQHEASFPILKIWNTNSEGGGVIGLFNIFGSSWDQQARGYRFHTFGKAGASMGQVRAADCHALVASHAAGDTYAIHLHNVGRLHLVRSLNEVVTCGVLGRNDFEVATVVRSRMCESQVLWASIGFTHLFNCGGTVLSEQWSRDAEAGTAMMKISLRGSGKFIALCCVRPAVVLVNSVSHEYVHQSQLGVGFTEDGIREEAGQLQLHLAGPYAGTPHEVVVRWEGLGGNGTSIKPPALAEDQSSAKKDD